MSTSIRFVDLRVIRKSITEDVGARFKVNPPLMPSWSRPWNVYNIIDMANENKTLVNPYVFVIDAHAMPTPTRIPMVVVDPTYVFNSMQLGSRSGCDVTVALACWGRTRSERDDIATMLANVYAGKFGGVSSQISIWTTLDNSTQASTAEVSGNVVVEFPTAGDALSKEGTLRNWSIVSFGLRVH